MPRVNNTFVSFSKEFTLHWSHPMGYLGLSKREKEINYFFWFFAKEFKKYSRKKQTSLKAIKKEIS